MKRYCEDFIRADLEKKMVFVGGPRQVGKTTLSKALCTERGSACEYFNWDVDDDRFAIRNKQWKEDSELIIFDELHKFLRWKNWIKGVYDSKPSQQQYLVTGSARLDVYKRGGDSLMGRYHYWRLHPLTIDELPSDMTPEDGFERLMTIGGFPEPFLLNDVREARRWRRERFQRIIREDIRDLEHVRELQLLSIFIEALSERVSSMITLANIARDLEVSSNTIKSWLNVVERMYIAFPIMPLVKNVPRGIKKPPKVYFYDNADVVEKDNRGARLENLVATTLLKRLHFMEDYYGHKCKLHYLRDKEGREVDFAVLIDNELVELIEVKSSSKDISTSLKYYTNKLKPKRSTQIVADLKRPFDSQGIRVTSPIEYFKNPPWSSSDME